MSRPNYLSVPCPTCGIAPESPPESLEDRRHEYHHANYSADSQEKVECLCSACHAKQHKWVQRKRNQKGQFDGINN